MRRHRCRSWRSPRDQRFVAPLLKHHCNLRGQRGLVVRKMQTRLMSSHGIRFAIGSLALCFASSAGAQGSLEQGKTAAQLYAANCASCHKSPLSVTKATGIFGLESFLRGQYTPSSQSAATIATYLNGLERQSSVRARGTKHTSQANALKPSPSKTKEDKSSVARALNSAADTAERTLNRLLQAIKPEND